MIRSSTERSRPLYGPAVTGDEARRPRVAIVVLNWNGKDHTKACLSSLVTDSYPSATIIVVDNGSTDGSLDMLRRDFPESATLRYISSTTNLGYAGGNNLGIVRAIEDGAEYVLLLNNDTLIDPGFLDCLVSVIEREARVGVVGPKVLCHPRRDLIFSEGERYSLWFNWRRTIDVGALDDQADHPPRDVDYVVGCAILVSREFVGRVGLLDETFFLYYEEMDWCFRGRKLGFRVVYVPQARVYHRGGASTGGEGQPLVEYYKTRNLIYFMRKHAAPYHWIMFVPVFCLSVTKRLIRAFRHGNRAAIVAIAHALWWQFRPESVYARMPPGGHATGVPPTPGYRETS